MKKASRFGGSLLTLSAFTAHPPKQIEQNAVVTLFPHAISLGDRMNRFTSIAALLAISTWSVLAVAGPKTKSYACPSTITVAGTSTDAKWKQSITSNFDGRRDLKPDPNNPKQLLLWCSYTISKEIAELLGISNSP